MRRLAIVASSLLLVLSCALPALAELDAVTVSLLGIGLPSPSSASDSRPLQASRAHVALAQDIAVTKNYDLAIAQADEAIRICPTRDAYLTRAFCLIKSGAYRSALADLAKARLLAPSDPAVIALMGHVCSLIPDPQGLRDAIATLSKLAPRHSDEARVLRTAIDQLSAPLATTRAGRLLARG